MFALLAHWEVWSANDHDIVEQFARHDVNADQRSKVINLPDESKGQSRAPRQEWRVSDRNDRRSEGGIVIAMCLETSQQLNSSSGRQASETHRETELPSVTATSGQHDGD